MLVVKKNPLDKERNTKKMNIHKRQFMQFLSNNRMAVAAIKKLFCRMWFWNLTQSGWNNSQY